jgi:hypothetical protein
MCEKFYLPREGLVLARVPDSPGLGGSTETNAPNWAT